MFNNNSFDTIDILSINITSRSDKWFLKPHFILSCNGGKFVPKFSTGIPKAVCIVVPSTCIAATPVGAISKTLGFSITTSPYDKVFVSDWYMTFIKKDLPHPAFPVKNMCRGFIFSKVCGFSDQLFKTFLAQL